VKERVFSITEAPYTFNTLQLNKESFNCEKMSLSSPSTGPSPHSSQSSFNSEADNNSGLPKDFDERTAFVTAVMKCDTLIFACRIKNEKTCKVYSLATGVWEDFPALEEACEIEDRPILHIVGTNLVFLAID